MLRFSSLNFLLSFCIEETYTEMYNEKQNTDIKIKAKELRSYKAGPILTLIFKHLDLQNGFIFSTIQKISEEV